MACDDNVRLLHGYIDGELDLVRSIEIEEHLKTCPDCAQELWNQQTLRKAFRSSNLYERAPAGLAGRIHASIAREVAEAAPEQLPEVKTTRLPLLTKTRTVWNWLAVAAAIVLVVAFAFTMLPRNPGREASDLLAQEIVSSHIRSLQTDHLFDVRSGDQRVVKPWFDGKLDFSPPVRDLSEDGYLLEGGRLDYVDHRAVAALVYQRGRHLINVFIWPEGKEEEEAFRSKSAQGYNMVFWERNGMYHCAVSDLNAGELEQFTQLLQN